MSDLRLLKVSELNQALSIWLGIQFTKHQAAKQQDLGIQGDKCVSCNACSVYCTSLLCVLFKVWSMFFTVCAMCIIQGVICELYI